jgi:hypothetical protein
LTRDSNVVTLHLRAKIVPYAASCCTYSVEDSSTTDSNCVVRVLRHWNSLKGHWDKRLVIEHADELLPWSGDVWSQW